MPCCLKGRTTLSDDLKALRFVVLSVVKRQARGKVFVAFHAAQEAGGEFFQCPQVNVAFKINHFVNGSPILVPTPAVKFGMVAGAQIDVAVAPDQPQKIPNLLLPAIRTAPFAAYPVARHVVTQPVARAADDFDVLRQ